MWTHFTEGEAEDLKARTCLEGLLVRLRKGDLGPSSGCASRHRGV